MKKRLKIFILIAISIVLMIALVLYVFKSVRYGSIDCEQIYKESKANEARGIAANLTPEAIEKCYSK